MLFIAVGVYGDIRSREKGGVADPFFSIPPGCGVWAEERVKKMALFQPGTTVFVQRSGSKAKSNSVLLGAKGKDFLFVEAPLIGDSAMFSQIGEKCVVRLLNKGKIVGFRSKIVKLLYDPFPMIMIEYPRNFEIRDLRENVRLDCNIAARLRTGDPPPGAETDPPDAPSSERTIPELPHIATIVNLSESGFRMAVPVFPAEIGEEPPEDFPENIRPKSKKDYRLEILEKTYRASDSVKLDFALPAPVRKQYEGVSGEVRWVAGSENKHLFMGVQLVEPDGNVLAGIRETIAFQSKYFISRYPTS